MSFYRRYGKRLFDATLAAFGLVLFSPVIGAVALLIRVKMNRPILFKQVRPGLHGRPFTLLKFRTMSDARDARGNLLDDGRRLTRLGSILRSMSLDELPELLNVLKGEMSLVGPRPLLVRYYPYFTREERVRFSVRPGVTGLAQISGRNDLSWDLRLAADVEYVRSISFWLDLRILGSTVLKVLSRQGLRVDPRATMLDFDEERKARLEGEAVGYPSTLPGAPQL